MKPGLQRWTNHVAIWVALGGAAAVAQCRRRGPVRDVRELVPAPTVGGWGTPPADSAAEGRRGLIDDLGTSTHRELVRHVVRL